MKLPTEYVLPHLALLLLAVALAYGCVEREVITVTVGDLTISNVVLNGNGGLFRADSGGTLNVTFDIETRALTLDNVARDGADATLPEGCTLASTELGQLNPRTTVIELSIDCAAVEVPGLGAVPIRGTVIVERLEWPE